MFFELNGGGPPNVSVLGVGCVAVLTTPGEECVYGVCGSECEKGLMCPFASQCTPYIVFLVFYFHVPLEAG